MQPNNRMRAVAAVLPGLLFNPATATTPPEVRVVPELRIAEGASQKNSYRYVPAIRVVEGQEIYYTVYVRNRGKESLQDYVLTLPVPQNTFYVANTATGAGAEVTFSLDGGKTFARPERLRRGDSVQDARAPASSYTHIRWQWSYSLPPDSVVLARFRAVFK